MITEEQIQQYPELCRYLPVNYLPVKLARGIHESVSREVYDSIPALSSTVIKQWLRYQSTPSVFKYWLDRRWDETPSEALILGNALDCMRLHNGLFYSRYATVPPGAPKRPSKTQVNAKKPSPETLGAIAWWDKFQKENLGKTLLTTEQITRVVGMNKALRDNPGLAGVFENCQKSVLVGAIDGWQCKAEIDLWNPRSVHIMDIKSAEDVRPQGFYRAIDRFGYITQATWYLSLAQSLGVEKTCFDFIAVGNEEPYPVKVHSFDITDSNHAFIYASELARIKAAIRSLTFALTEQDFRDDSDWHAIEFPAWQVIAARNEVEEL